MKIYTITRITVPDRYNVFTITYLCDMAKLAHMVTVSSALFIYLGKNIIKL
jgi:hypothetical protein